MYFSKAENKTSRSELQCPHFDLSPRTHTHYIPINLILPQSICKHLSAHTASPACQSMPGCYLLGCYLQVGIINALSCPPCIVENREQLLLAHPSVEALQTSSPGRTVPQPGEMLRKKQLFYTLWLLFLPHSLLWTPFSQGETANPFQSSSWARTVTQPVFCSHQITFPENREAAPLLSLLPTLGFIPCFGGQPFTANLSSCCSSLRLINPQELQLLCSYTVIVA